MTNPAFETPALFREFLKHAEMTNENVTALENCVIDIIKGNHQLKKQFTFIMSNFSFLEMEEMHISRQKRRLFSEMKQFAKEMMEVGK